MALGQVFTPPALADLVLARIPSTPERILDPSCGDGNFLAAAARRWPSARLFGFEADPAVAAQARERLPQAVIEVADALSLPVDPGFDLVAGNPPYAAAFRDADARSGSNGGALAALTRARLRADHVTVSGSFDLSVPFVERAVKWLRPGGWLALVVTNKILVKDYAAKLRAWLLAEVAIRELWDLAAAPAFPGVAIDVAILIAQRAARARSRIVLGCNNGSRESYNSSVIPGDRGRWEVFRTPPIAALLEAIEASARLSELENVTIRDGIQGRNYHRVAIVDCPCTTSTQNPTHSHGHPVVGVGRIERGGIRWDRTLKRGDQTYTNPHVAASGALLELAEAPKILVRGVARSLVAANCPQPAVPLVAVRAILGHSDPEALTRWLNHPLASFYLQVTCRSDRIPGGSYNVSKAWLQHFPAFQPARELHAHPRPAASAWLAAYGI
ncbi:MAG: N-6 DNA methylase [Candidatus Sericytochromatia bacterium]|uniref:site-specific DNA-methyltransferase (adenine-specific) n=1 Tax=Candidatus Tanganyikabacteria bacterium TaxID=2961651 RepID=A0A937X1I0_9BACT|nr:N-6 DNA methylase [Candidatus Tanganyikabacteria bacterium]